jgi:hypothetical protein
MPAPGLQWVPKRKSPNKADVDQPTFTDFDLRAHALDLFRIRTFHIVSNGGVKLGEAS